MHEHLPIKQETYAMRGPSACIRFIRSSAYHHGCAIIDMYICL